MSGGSLGDWLTDRALRGLIATARRLPWERRLALMGGALTRVIGPLAGYRSRAERHLAMIWPDLPLARRRAIARDVLDNFGRTVIENYSGAEFGARLQGSPISGEGLPALEAAVAAGRPVIFVTGHFGNHEAPRQVLTGRGLRIGGLYRPMRNPYVNDHYARTMTELSGPVFEQGPRGTLGFARHLRGGGLATLLFDVHASEGVAIPFLGRPAMTSTAAATLALRFDALLMPYFGTRQPDGISFDVALEAPIPPSDPVAMTEEMTRRLEARVLAHPGQWFWVHRRWKAPRGT